MQTLRKYLAGAIFTCLTGAAFSQPMWGVTGGLNFSSLSASDYKLPADKRLFEMESIRRIRMGIRTERPLKRWLYFQGELNYVMKGGIVKGDSTYDEIFIPPGYIQETQWVDNIDLSYIELPLLMKAQLQLTQPNKMYPYENTGNPLFLDIFLGPYVAYALGAESFYSSTVKLTSADTTVLPNQNYKTTQTRGMTGIGGLDFGIIAGLGLKLKVSRKTMIFIDGRYQVGMADINKGYFDYWMLNPTAEKPLNYEKISPVIKNAGQMAIQFGLTTNLTGRRYYWLNK